MNEYIILFAISIFISFIIFLYILFREFYYRGYIAGVRDSENCIEETVRKKWEEVTRNE